MEYVRSDRSPGSDDGSEIPARVVQTVALATCIILSVGRVLPDRGGSPGDARSVGRESDVSEEDRRSDGRPGVTETDEESFDEEHGQVLRGRLDNRGDDHDCRVSRYPVYPSPHSLRS
jgi:hypothetical protein